MLVLPASVTLPLACAVPLPTKAPMLPSPVPTRLKASLPMLTPLMFNVAPLATTVPEAMLPSAPALLTTKVPISTRVAPL